MFPTVIIQIAVLIILVRSAYIFFQGIQAFRKNWLELLYHLSVALIALNFLL